MKYGDWDYGDFVVAEHPYIAREEKTKWKRFSRWQSVAGEIR
jgi:hypothetical protein